MKDTNRLNRVFTNKLFTTVVSIFLGLIIAGLLMIAVGINPLEAYSIMISGIFTSPRNIAEVIIKATPIIITGVSVAFAFKTGLFNIGAEGQYIFGFVCTGIVGILLNLHSIIQIPLLLIVGMLAGVIFGGLSGLLKAKFGVHEVISGIMLNWIALYFHNYIALSSPLFIQETAGTDSINVSGQIKLFAAEKAAGDYQSMLDVPVIGPILSRSDINYGIIIAIIVAIVFHFIIKKTTLGYQLRAVGFNKDAAEFAGINVSSNIIKAMAISGAIAGLAGAVNIMSLSPHRISSMVMFENYGFDGLSVALIAGSNILATILAGLLFSILRIGGNILQLQLRTPSEIISVLIGVIIFFIALSSIMPYIAQKLESRKKRGKNDNN